MWKIVRRSSLCNILNNQIKEVLTGAKQVFSTSERKKVYGNSSYSITTRVFNPQTMNASASPIKPQKFDYFLVLDFEATCEDGTQIVPQEIIEFPVLKVNAKTLQTEATFHEYVQPRKNPTLTSFCTEAFATSACWKSPHPSYAYTLMGTDETQYISLHCAQNSTTGSGDGSMLTGIIQDMVDNQPYIEDVMQKFDAWMSENGLLDDEVKSIFVTCGDWDLKKMLPGQCQYFNIPSRPYFSAWINIKKSFSEFSSIYPKGIMHMLQQLQISHQGRLHSGIDDCRNISAILCEMIKRGFVLKQNGSL